MRGEDAETDADERVTTKVGSRSLMFRQSTRQDPAKRFVYDRNPTVVAERSSRPYDMADGEW